MSFKFTNNNKKIYFTRLDIFTFYYSVLNNLCYQCYNAVAARIPKLKKKVQNLLIRKFLQLRRVTRKFLQNLGAHLAAIY